MPAFIKVWEELNNETRRILRVLSRHVQETDIRAFVASTTQMSEPRDKNNIDAVLQVSVSANKDIYDAIRRRDKLMCDALKELMKEEIEEITREREQETLLESIKNLMESTKWTVEQAMAALKIPDADKGKYLAKL